MQVALYAATLGVGHSHAAGQRVRKRGVELRVVDSELRSLGLDEAALQESSAKATLDRVPGDYADDDGRKEEEIVVDEDFKRRGLKPHGYGFVTDHDGQARPRGIGEAKLQQGVCPWDDEEETCVVQVPGRGASDGDHRY